MAREAGAKSVYFSSCAPEVTNPHIYGIDLASPSELIAHEKNRFDIAKHIGVEELIFQDLDDLKDACLEVAPNGPVTGFEVGVFCGSYVTEVPEGYLERLNKIRGVKSDKLEVIAETQAEAVANDGPINVSANAPTRDTIRIDLSNGDVRGGANGLRSITYRTTSHAADNREDIRYVIFASLHEMQSEANVMTAFTTWQRTTTDETVFDFRL